MITPRIPSPRSPQPRAHLLTRRCAPPSCHGHRHGRRVSRGVLRALHEAGVKIDLVAGRGIGASARCSPPSTAVRGSGTNRIWYGAARFVPGALIGWRAALV